MADVRRDPAGEGQWRLADRKRVAGVEADADALEFLAEVDELLAFEILMVLDRQRDPRRR